MSGARPWLRSESMRSFTAASGHTTAPALARGDLLVRVEARTPPRLPRAPTGAPSACTAPSASQLSSTIHRPRSARQRARAPACRRGSRRCAPAAGPVVRSPTAAAAARGSMLSVRGSMSQNTGRAFSYSRQLAEATKRERRGDDLVARLDRPPRGRRGGGRRCRSTRPRRGLAPAAPRARPRTRGSRGPSDRRPRAQRLEDAAPPRRADARPRERDHGGRTRPLRALARAACGRAACPPRASPRAPPSSPR